MTAPDDLREEISRVDLELLRDAGRTLQRLAGGHFGKEGIPRAVEQEAEAAFRVAQTLAEALYGTGDLEAGSGNGDVPDAGEAGERAGDGGPEATDGSPEAAPADDALPDDGPDPTEPGDAVTDGASPSP